MTREDRDQLLNYVIPMAKQLLAKYGEFYPFGAHVTSEGKVGGGMGYTESERPTVQEMTDLVVGGLRDEVRRKTVRATAVYVNVTIELPDIGRTDAIRITLEDADQEALNAVLPYSILSPGHVDYRELMFGRARPLVFSPSSAP